MHFGQIRNVGAVAGGAPEEIRREWKVRRDCAERVLADSQRTEPLAITQLLLPYHHLDAATRLFI